MKTYKVPFAYERYGHIIVTAESEKDALQQAEKRLENMTLAEMKAASEYLMDSAEIDYDGIITVQE